MKRHISHFTCNFAVFFSPLAFILELNIVKNKVGNNYVCGHIDKKDFVEEEKKIKDRICMCQKHMQARAETQTHAQM